MIVRWLMPYSQAVSCASAPSICAPTMPTVNAVFGDGHPRARRLRRLTYLASISMRSLPRGFVPMSVTPSTLDSLWASSSSFSFVSSIYGVSSLRCPASATSGSCFIDVAAVLSFSTSCVSPVSAFLAFSISLSRSLNVVPR